MRIRSLALLVAFSSALTPVYAQTTGSSPADVSRTAAAANTTASDLTPSTASAALDTPIRKPDMPTIPAQPLQLRIQATRPLKLQDAVSLVLDRNPQLLTARYAVDRAEAVKRQAEAALFPTVSLNVNYTYSQSPQSAISRALISGESSSTTGPSTLAQGIQFLNTAGFTPAESSALSSLLFSSSGSGINNAFLSESATITGTAAINWTIFSSGLVGSNILAAEESLKATRLQYETTRQDLINTVIGAYYDLQTADGNVQIGDAAVKSNQASVRDARAQEQAGTGTRFAVLQAEVNLANAVQQKLSADNQREISQRNLARLLNYATPTAVEAVDPIEEAGTWNLGLEETIMRALNQRTELAYQDSLRRSAKATQAAAYASISPQVNVFLNGQFFDNLIDRSVGIFTGYTIGAQIQWNAFDGGAAVAQADQAIATARTAEANFIDTFNTVRYSVESSISSLTTARQQIDTATTAVASAEEALRLARLRFQAGVGTQTDVLIADTSLTQARVNRLTAVISYNRALASIRRSVGIL
ncbi:TolC family protein [Gloeobacter kilaueensis]|uniref:Outer membrane efflux protein n=1 Tax=Gloeobacter kilaueensis (strain ATCC BAA-2537 / CCAP 1431/1 / ULC 316 / JS1) TaxID=1183438 RepID=U5QLY1_GLOK1|nr:TolC family protein [Gloeobacter kilaueensis]AGY59992.1 outer membrane efflux protein [Gloeobacter kilaueensis JS1]